MFGSTSYFLAKAGFRNERDQLHKFQSQIKEEKRKGKEKTTKNRLSNNLNAKMFHEIKFCGTFIFLQGY